MHDLLKKTSLRVSLDLNLGGYAKWDKVDSGMHLLDLSSFQTSHKVRKGERERIEGKIAQNKVIKVQCILKGDLRCCIAPKICGHKHDF